MISKYRETPVEPTRQRDARTYQAGADTKFRETRREKVRSGVKRQLGAVDKDAVHNRKEYANDNSETRTHSNEKVVVLAQEWLKILMGGCEQASTLGAPIETKQNGKPVLNRNGWLKK